MMATDPHSAAELPETAIAGDQERSRLGRLLPGLRVLSHYRASWLRADALAGVAVAAYLVPQVMAYAVIAGVAPAAGLWSAVVALLAYALIGTSRQLSVGPESTTALMTAATVAPLAGGDPVRYAALASCLALLVGGMCVLGRFVAAGALADLLSTPVLVGYLAGISVTMIVGQLSRVTGVPVSGESVPAQLRSFAGAAGQWHWPTVVIAAGVFALLWAGLKLRPNWPIVLLGLLTATVAVALFGAADAGVALVGAAATGLPRLGLPLLTQGEVGALLLPALGVALVGYSDNVLTARAFSRGQPGKIDNDQELSALGIGNLLAGLVHGMPISSSASRTAVGVAQGSRTQLYSLVAVGVVVLAMSAGGSLLAAFPVPALGAIVAYAAIKLIDLPAFRRDCPAAYQRAVARAGHHRRGAGHGCPERRPGRGGVVVPRSHPATGPTARRRTRLRRRNRRHARPGRLPAGPPRARAARLPL
jgi:MFS superfamily sulfate permease-like transporter